MIAEAGETTGLVVTFQDLTEIRALEQQSRRQDQLAAIGRVSAGIAHEIRNPLAAMSRSIQMLRAELDNDSNSSELMEIVLRESERLNRIITDFLLYARPRPCELTTSDLREPLREMRRAASQQSGDATHALLRRKPSAGSADRALRFGADAASLLEPREERAAGDAKRRHVLNRHEACAERQCTSNIYRHRLRRVRRTARELFEPFSSSKASGTGLGLSIVYQIIQDHKGSISVLSKEGEGTAFIIELPGGSLAADSRDTTTTTTANASEELAPLYG
ncbi:MAG: histidine kinase dimerization/phospho-acceptor domain-containing protein [Pyrinomonadaceae bacterium]